MHQIMQDLHQDHIHLAKVLCVLDIQLEKLASEEDADLFLMIDILDYIQHYPDLVHHPKEDKVYQVFKAYSSVAEDIVEELMDEHKQLPDISKGFHQLLDGAANDIVFVSREELYDKLQEFIAVQRRHMNIEEEKLFPLINLTLSSDDWALIDKAIEKSADPLFGGSVEACYQSLYESINKECS